MNNLNSNNSNLPKYYRKAIYVLNEKGRYIKEPEIISFNKLPEYLKIELARTEQPKYNGAETVIHGSKLKGKYIFYTGLRETGLLNWQYGNDHEISNGIKSRSLVLFNFGNENRQLIVYYFVGWYYYSIPILVKLIRIIISILLKNGNGK